MRTALSSGPCDIVGAVHEPPVRWMLFRANRDSPLLVRLYAPGLFQK